jgi:hypothetical protein
MWGFEENEEVDEDIGMAVAGFLFLVSKIHKKNKRLFGRRQNRVNEKY